MTNPGTAAAPAETNPLLAPSDLPFGLPPFGRITEDHYAPALDAAMAEHLDEVEAIVDNPEPATFENTIVAMERCGAALTRVAAVLFNLTSTNSTPRLREIEAEYSPRFTAHLDAVRHNPRLFARVDAVFRDRENAELTADQLALVERYHLDFVLAGAQLDEDGRHRLADLNQQIATLSTSFQQHLLAEMESSVVVLDSADELEGLSDDAVGAAATAAAERGHPGKYLLALILPSGQPALAHLRNRAVRERLHRASVERGLGGEHATGGLAIEMAALRAKRAALMGFPSHAALTVVDQTAKTVAAVEGLLGRLVGPAVANASAEADKLRVLATADGVELAAWDWAYYAERVRAQEFSVDTTALRPYFELNRVLNDGVFHAAELLFGITFRVRDDLTGYHPDVQVWEVLDEDESPIGLYLGDFYAREGKRGGAWMSSFVEQSRLLDTRPVVFNSCNFNRAPEGEPTLLTLDEVVTLFHEFGHALHGLFSDVTYPRQSGTSVPRDFVEYPSQVNEMWVLWPDIVETYARHIRTGEPLPADTIAAIRAAEKWGSGFATCEYLGATLLDWAWHTIDADTVIGDATEFEIAALEKAGLASELIPPRYRTGYFQHIFAGGYSAGYYSYIWSEVLDADTVEWFKENHGLHRGNGDVFRSKLLGVGGSKDSLAAFRDLRGRDADIRPLLIRRGLVAAEPAS